MNLEFDVLANHFDFAAVKNASGSLILGLAL